MLCWQTVKVLYWTSEGTSRVLLERHTSDAPIVVRTEAELLAQRPEVAVTFVDETTLAQLDGVVRRSGRAIPAIAVIEGPLANAVHLLAAYSWIGHIVSASTTAQPMWPSHIRTVVETMLSDRTPKLLRWLTDVEGRRVTLAHASKRLDRLDRIGEFFETNGVSARATQQLRDVAEELLTNAFYDAPVAAGMIDQPISRTQDVMLPDEAACDLVYGCRDDLAFVRVRDPFGALTRERLVEVLSRCSKPGMQVEVDESMGGAGLGLWKIFSSAAFVAISVVKHRRTEFLVGFRKKPAPGAKPFAMHLFFTDRGHHKRGWQANEHLENTLTLR